MHEPDVRPPYQAAAPGDTLGERHVVEALRDLPFPATRDELLARAGRWRMPITGARFVTLEEMMTGVRGRTFRSADDVARAIGKAHPEWRE
ncbi:MAG TPA: hypothetical protein VHH36_04005 [Candidatus Thermoplasmatota archaeon]|nr:hypothetical protein [Candidatus Thermoplasmatota archaeon]